MKTSRNFLASAVLVIATSLLISGCTDSDLLKLAHALRDTSNAVAAIQHTVISANKNGLMSDNDTRPILQLMVKVNNAALAADMATRKLAVLAPADRGNLAQILSPLVGVLSDSDAVTAAIKNPKARKDIQASLQLIQAAVTTAQLIAAGGK